MIPKILASRPKKLIDRTVLKKYLEGTIDMVSDKKPARLPMVLTQDEDRCVFVHLRGEKLSMAQLLYLSWLRLMECLRLRVKDGDFLQCQIFDRYGKGHILLHLPFTRC